ncbi:MAG: hypothetical protein LBC17_04310, partial [Lactobacillaceae bacterium]|nr:hypothetical protein [Lactobacillaceae bacterium]
IQYISTNNLENKYIYPEIQNIKKKKIKEISDNLLNNVPIANSVVYNKKTYYKSTLVNKLSELIYDLQFNNLNIKMIGSKRINRIKTSVTVEGRQINISDFLNSLLAQANSDLKEQQGISSLSQSQYSLAEFIFMEKNWDKILNNTKIEGSLIRSKIVLNYDAKINRFFIFYDDVKKIQGVFIK